MRMIAKVTRAWWRRRSRSCRVGGRTSGKSGFLVGEGERESGV